VCGKWHTKGSVDFRPVAAYIRKVRTASGATAVQIAAKQGRRDKVLEPSRVSCRSYIGDGSGCGVDR